MAEKNEPGFLTRSTQEFLALNPTREKRAEQYAWLRSVEADAHEAADMVGPGEAGNVTRGQK